LILENKNKPHRYLLYIGQNYSFEILRPLQQELRNLNIEVVWFVSGNEVDMSLFQSDEKVFTLLADILKYNPTVTLVPGNEVLYFLPGIKVQVFHGLESKKKRRILLKGFYDLYCTCGKAQTKRFRQLASQHGYFDVVETGWPKLDSLYSAKPLAEYKSTTKPIVLYAPTFSAKLTSVYALFSQFELLSQQDEYLILIKFHPKIDSTCIAKYRRICNENMQILETGSIADLLQTADVMVSDTSSVISEFSLLNKPVVTLNNVKPEKHLFNFSNPLDLIKQLNLAVHKLRSGEEIVPQGYLNDLDPFRDGLSSKRVVLAVEHILEKGKQNNGPKPINFFRKFKQRKKINYWEL